LIGKILNDVRSFQQGDYAFAEDAAVLAWLAHAIQSEPTDALTRRSRALEPPLEV
jgi:hypothetical protein